jgi:signal transduction histidine kinase
MNATAVRHDTGQATVGALRWLLTNRRLEMMIASVVAFVGLLLSAVVSYDAPVESAGTYWFILSVLSVCSATGVLLVPQSPRLAALFATAPILLAGWGASWLLAYWALTQLAVVAAAAAQSWRLAIWPLVGGLVTASILYDYDGLRQGWYSFADWYLAAVVVAFGLSAAAGVVVRSESAQRALTIQQSAVRQIGSAQAERARLARDLHDVVAHHISLVAVRAETAPYTDPAMQPADRAVLQEIAGDARRALNELRAVLGVLQRSEDQPELAPQPTLRDVPELIDRACRAGDRVIGYGLDAMWLVPDTIGYVAYRVVQEALTNARRHAPGALVEVLLERDSDELVVTVANEPPAAHSAISLAASGEAGGLGLTAMAERIRAIGGLVVAGPDARGGFSVTARLPVDERG